MFDSDRGKEGNKVSRRVFLAGVGAALGGRVVVAVEEAACNCGGEVGAGRSDDCAIFRRRASGWRR